MPSSTKFSQTRYCVPGLRRVGGSAPARRAGARPLTPALRHTSPASGAGRRIVPRAGAPPPPRRQPPAALASTAAVVAAAAAAVRPPQACPRAHVVFRPRGAPSRGADSTPAPTAARTRGSTSCRARSSSRSAASSTSAARSGPRKAAAALRTAAAVETNLVTFTSAIGGVRNALASPHRARTRRRARRARASTRRPPPLPCATSAGAATRGVMSSTADLRSRDGRPVGTDDLCAAAAADGAMTGLSEGWSAPRRNLVTQSPGDPCIRRDVGQSRDQQNFLVLCQAIGDEYRSLRLQQHLRLTRRLAGPAASLTRRCPAARPLSTACRPCRACRRRRGAPSRRRRTAP